MLARLVVLSALVLVDAQRNWRVTYNDVGAEDYELIMEWDHDNALSPVVSSFVRVPSKDGVCSPDAGSISPTDGKLWWVPRIYPRAVPEEVTRKTGVTFASVDWQPCGHKDVVICHAESHYDFHLYYVSQSELSEYTCTGANPTCPDTTQVSDATSKAATDASLEKNMKFFNLMRGNMPTSLNGRPVNFCVDPTSAMPESGVHYGDKSETLNEWTKPVTIMGSYDCKLTFFEPMFSWRWTTGQVRGSTWPIYESGEIIYDEKNFHPLPTSWKLHAGQGCQQQAFEADPTGCHLTLTVRGKRCTDPAGCGPLPQDCGQQRNCKTDRLMGHLTAASPNTTLAAATSSSAPASTSTSGSSSDTTAAASTTTAAPTGAPAAGTTTTMPTETSSSPATTTEAPFNDGNPVIATPPPVSSGWRYAALGTMRVQLDFGHLLHFTDFSAVPALAGQLQTSLGAGLASYLAVNSTSDVEVTNLRIASSRRLDGTAAPTPEPTPAPTPAPGDGAQPVAFDYAVRADSSQAATQVAERLTITSASADTVKTTLQRFVSAETSYVSVAGVAETVPADGLSTRADGQTQAFGAPSPTSAAAMPAGAAVALGAAMLAAAAVL